MATALLKLGFLPFLCKNRYVLCGKVHLARGGGRLSAVHEACFVSHSVRICEPFLLEPGCIPVMH